MEKRTDLQTDQEAANAAVPHAEPNVTDRFLGMTQEEWDEHQRYLDAVGANEDGWAWQRELDGEWDEDED